LPLSGFYYPAKLSFFIAKSLWTLEGTCENYVAEISGNNHQGYYFIDKEDKVYSQIFST